MTEAQKVSVDLAAEQVEALQAAVDAGEYATVAEAADAAVRDWRRGREPRENEASRLRRLWDEGKASGAPEAFDVEQTLAAARARLPKIGAV